MRDTSTTKKCPNSAIWLRRMGTLLLLLTIHLFSSHSTAADTILDVVLVMDSSGSMKKTDPRDLRKSAAKLFISLLGKKDRVSVVSFSDQGYPVAWFSSPNGKANRKKLFAAVDKISNRGLYTNLSGAIDGALRVIDRDPLPNRKQIVVLMSDGQMDLGSDKASAKQTKRLKQGLLPILKRQNIELHTIAFTDQSDKGILEKMAISTGGKFNIANNDKQLHEVYTAIFEQNKQPNMLPFNGEELNIDNTITEVTIVGSKDSEKTRLSLISPSGKTLTRSNKPAHIKWFAAETFDLISIKNPKPGTWKLKSGSGKNKAYIVSELKMQLTAETSGLAIGEGLLISAWLEDKNKTITKSNILSNVAMNLKMVTPAGQTQQIKLKPNPNGVFLDRIALPSQGSYKLEVVAHAREFSRQRNIQISAYGSPARKPDPSALETDLAAELTAEQSTEHLAAHLAAQHETPSANEKDLEQDLEQDIEMDLAFTGANQSEAISHSPSEHALQELAHLKHESGESKQKTHSQEKTEKDKKPGTTADAKPEAAAEIPEANLQDTLLIFLGINVFFLSLGTAGYFVLKKKNSTTVFKEIKA